MDDFRAADGQQPFRDVIAFEADDAAVRQAMARDRAAHLFHTAQHALGAEEIPLWKTRRHREQERTVAAAEINLQRCGPRKDVGHYRATDMIAGLPERAICGGEEGGVFVLDGVVAHGADAGFQWFVSRGLMVLGWSAQFSVLRWSYFETEH